MSLDVTSACSWPSRRAVRGHRQARRRPASAIASTPSMTDAAEPDRRWSAGRSRPAIGWSALPAPAATQARTARRGHDRLDAMVPVHDGDSRRNRWPASSGATSPNAGLRAAALERLAADHVVQEHRLGIARVVRPLVVRGHRVVRLDELARVRDTSAPAPRSRTRERRRSPRRSPTSPSAGSTARR